MPDYQKLYTLLFNAITDAMNYMKEHSRFDDAYGILYRAQLEAEARYIEADDFEEET